MVGFCISEIATLRKLVEMTTQTVLHPLSSVFRLPSFWGKMGLLNEGTDLRPGEDPKLPVLLDS